MKFPDFPDMYASGSGKTHNRDKLYLICDSICGFLWNDDEDNDYYDGDDDDYHYVCWDYE